MSLPDPETTEAEPVEIDDDATLEQIADDNPFKQIIADLKDGGDSWREVWELLEDAYDPVYLAAHKESLVRIPEFKLKAVVADERATSGGRYEWFTHAAETEDAAREWVESKPDVVRVESAEKVGMVTVG